MPIPGKKCLPLPASPYAVDHLHRHKIHSSTSPLSRGVPKTRNIPPAAGHKPAGSHKSVRCPWLRAWNAFNEGSSSSKTTQCETLRLAAYSSRLFTLPRHRKRSHDRMYGVQVDDNARLLGAHQLSEPLSDLGRVNKYATCDRDLNLCSERPQFADHTASQLAQCRGRRTPNP